MTQERVEQAAFNNAVWCDTVCRAHGRPGEFLDGMWINRRETPRFYPNAVMLAEAGASSTQLERIRDLVDEEIPGNWAVKDSFSALDLGPLGFQILFEAAWLYWPASLPRPDGDIAGVRWATVSEVSELAQWEMAWSGAPVDEGVSRQSPLFLPSLLTDESVVVVAAYRRERMVAGAIANRTGGVVGLSNLFVRDGDPNPFRAGCVAAVIEAFPALPLAGYEAGQELAAAQTLGFEVLGPLRVWSKVSGPE